ncbi:MAG: hypothetical protein M1828_005158 [Chrysothrix sp. TS-e1954]|nr:MAG: hypothetical protein M1828_005158 [Chrysothrix sp. TS-e1954]
MAVPDAEAEPVVIPVSDLTASTTFYLAILKPLGYQRISRAHHETSTGIWQSVGLGPENTTRVDICLSQSIEEKHHHHHKHRTVHILFPATSDLAVRDFHTAALGSGGTSILAPDTCTDQPNTFKAKVSDLDENTVEVSFCDPHEAQEAAARETRGIVEPAEKDNRERGSKHEHEHESIHEIRDKRQEVVAESASKARGGVGERRAEAPAAADLNPPLPRHSEHQAKFGSQTTINPTKNKTVVGALLATAAGGFLAYKAFQSKDDSQDRERSFSARIAARDRVKTEAQEAASASQAREERDTMSSGRDAWRSKARSGRRDSFVDRMDRADSGYYSSAPARNRGQSPTRKKYHYPPPSPDMRQTSRGRSVRSYETSDPIPIKYTTTRTRSPNTITPPSIPPPPTTRLRTSSSYRPSRSPPDPKPRSSASTSKPPPSSYPLKNAPQAVSRSPPPRSASAHSHQSRFSTTGQRTIQSPANPPSASLTAKALSSHTAASGGGPPSRAPPDSRGVLDELDTIVPDDSISCAPPPPRSSRRPRKDSSSKARSGDRRRSRSGLGGRLLGVVY